MGDAQKLFNSIWKTSSRITTFSTNVILEIYDITGRKIRQLANNYYTPGYHSVIWDASDVSSGVYFVKMNADGFNASQKLMLIK